MSWRATSELPNQQSQTVGANASEQIISKNFGITSPGALNMVVAIKASGVTAATGITAKLQTNPKSGIDSWEDSKTVSITGNDVFYIKLQTTNSSDQSFLPLLPVGRIVIDSGAGDAATIDDVLVIQES